MGSTSRPFKGANWKSGFTAGRVGAEVEWRRAADCPRSAGARLLVHTSGNMIQTPLNSAVAESLSKDICTNIETLYFSMTEANIHCPRNNK